METERANKRPRISGSFGGGSDLGEFDVMSARRANDLRLKSRFEAIFEKYAKDFTSVGDEIDLGTGDIIVDNGHIQTMRNEQDLGGDMWAHSNKKDHTLKRVPHSDHVTNSYSIESQSNHISLDGDIFGDDGPSPRNLTSHRFDKHEALYKSGPEGAFDIPFEQDGIMENMRDNDDAARGMASGMRGPERVHLPYDSTSNFHENTALHGNLARSGSPEAIDALWQAPQIDGLTRLSPMRRSPAAETPRTYRRSLSPVGSLWAIPKTRRRKSGVATYSKRTPKTVPKPKARKWQTGYESADSDDPLQDDFHSPSAFRNAPTRVTAPSLHSSQDEAVIQKTVSRGGSPCSPDHQHTRAITLPTGTDDEIMAPVGTDTVPMETEPPVVHGDLLGAEHLSSQNAHSTPPPEPLPQNDDEIIAQVEVHDSLPEGESSVTRGNFFYKVTTIRSQRNHHAEAEHCGEASCEAVSKTGTTLPENQQSPKRINELLELENTAIKDMSTPEAKQRGIPEDHAASDTQMQADTASSPPPKMTASHKSITPSEVKTIVTLRIAEKRPWKEVLASIPARKPQQIRNWYSRYCAESKINTSKRSAPWSSKDIAKLKSLVSSPPDCWDGLRDLFADRSKREIEYQWVKLCLGEETWQNWRPSRPALQKQDRENSEADVDTDAEVDELVTTPFRPPNSFLPSSVSLPRTPTLRQINRSETRETQTPALPSHSTANMPDQDSDSDDPLSEAFDTVWKGAGLSGIEIDTPPRSSISPRKASPHKKAFVRVSDTLSGVRLESKPN